MTLGELNFSEVLVFFRYRSFPIAINVLLLFSWVYILLLYLFNREKLSYLFLALGTCALFTKELVLFFTVRHVVFSDRLDPVAVDFVDWTILEAATAFIFIVCLANAYAALSFKHKFDYPPPKIFKNISLVFSLGGVGLLVIVAIAYLVDDALSPLFTMLLQLYVIGFMVYLALGSNRIRINYTAFSGGWLNGGVQIVFLVYLGLTIFISLCFVTMDAMFFSTQLRNLNLSSAVLEIPKNYFHAFKSYSYVVYALFLFLLIAKNYRLTTLFGPAERHISREVNLLGDRLRHMVLTYETPEQIIKHVLREVAAYTQAEFAFFCFYKKREQTLSYIDHVSGESKHKQALLQADLSQFLKNIVDRKRHIIIDELSELSPSFREHFSYLSAPPDSSAEDIVAISSEEHFITAIRSLLAAPAFSGSQLRYAIVLINKKMDYFDEWKEDHQYGYLEAVTEETRFLTNYLIDYDTFIANRNKVFDRYMGKEQGGVLTRTADMLQEQLQSVPRFELALKNSYTHLPTRTMVNMAQFQKKKPLVLFADIEGETAARSYLAGVLHAGFHLAAQHEKNIAAIMRQLNYLLALTQRKNFVNAVIYYYDQGRRKLFFSNATHSPIFIFHVASQELIAYDVDDPPLSAGTDAVYRELNTDINEGDVIIVCNDELLSIKNEVGEPIFTAARIGDLLRKLDEHDPQTVVEQLVLDCESLELPLTSQLTFLVARVGM